MDKLTIDGTAKSPTIICDPDGKIVIKGRSWPEHVLNIYQPVFDWLAEYGKSPKSETIVEVSLEYFNTSTSKVVLDIFKRLETLHAAGNTKVTVKWFYEKDDYDLQEEGETFSELVDIPVELVGIEEFDFSFA